MHYIIQESIYKPQNLQLLLEVLERLELPYDVVKAHADLSLEPEVNPQGKVFVFGAWRMAAVAQQRQWSPASFLNDNFDYVVWQQQLGTQLLNANAQVLKFKEIHDLQGKRYFMRPTKDTKAFDGAVFDADKVKALQSMTSKAYLLDMDVLLAPLQVILKEYRLFIVKHLIVTGSIYKLAGKPYFSDLLDEAAIQFAESIIKQWLPSEACVMDLALTEQGYKVIEFNNINSSGFYAANVAKLIQALEYSYN